MKAELKLPRWQVIHGDALDVLPVRAHMVLTDPPYAFDKMGADWSASDARPVTNGQTVGNLAAGMAFKIDQAEKARIGFVPFAEKIASSLVEGGFALVFAAPRLAHGFATALEDAGLAIRDILSWRHQGGQFKAASLRRFGVDDEDRVTPQPRPMFETIIVAQQLPQDTLAGCWRRNRTGLMARRSLVGELVTNELRFDKPDKAEREAGGRHPTQKPITLMAELIHRFSVNRQTVLDPFLGSGASGIAAIQLGRDFVGIERDAHFVTVANTRLQQEIAALRARAAQSGGNDEQ